LNILPAIVLTTIAVLLAGFVYQSVGSFRDRQRFPAPGRLVQTDGSQIHARVQGSGTPAVILEAGIAASSVSWEYVQREMAKCACTLSYDRAGLGWSEARSSPLTPEILIHDLRSVIALSGIKPPIVIVGHSFGGLLARLYARAYPDDVAGLVLVDPALTSEWSEPNAMRQAMLQRGVRLSRRGATLARFGVVRLGLSLAAAGARPLAKFVARASSRQGGQRTIERLVGEVRKLPPELLPIVRAHWSRPSAFSSMAQHIAILREVCSTLPLRPGELGALPLVVISGAHLTPEQQAEQASVATLSTIGRHIVAEGSGHWVHLDRPDLVVEAVREVLQGGQPAMSPSTETRKF